MTKTFRSRAKVRCNPLSRRSMMDTCHPDETRWPAMARPMPFAPPVIRQRVWPLTWYGFRRSIAFDRKIGSAAPFRPGTVVETSRFFAQRIQRKSQHRGGDARTASGDDRLIDVDTRRGKCGGDFFARFEPTIFDQPVVGQVERARHVTR